MVLSIKEDILILLNADISIEFDVYSGMCFQTFSLTYFSLLLAGTLIT